jgi:hypothetical protein
MTASNRFEDRLLDQLRHIVAERPAPLIAAGRRPRPVRLALVGIAAAATVTVVALVSTSSDVTPSAYAVDRRPDGSVTVEIHSLHDAAGLERRLRAAGVPAVVDYVAPGQKGCVAPGPGATDSESGGPILHKEGKDEGTARSGPSLSRPGPGPGADTGAMTTSKVTAGRGGTKFTIDPGTIDAGDKVYITTSTGVISTVGIAIGKHAPPVPCAG